MRKAVALVLSMLTAGTLVAKTEIRTVEYKAGDVVCKGIVAVDTAVEGKRPGVLVAPEWWGVNDYATSRAKMLADMGYVAFVADMYGDGKNTRDPKQAGEWSGAVKGNRPLMRARAEAALAQLKAQPETDPAHTAAIGYCFGGTTVLEMARDNADTLGVVSFHGGLAPGNAPTAKQIKPKVLVLHGAADRSVSDAQLAAFMDEMDKAGADWSLTAYGHAVHAFTNPASGNDPSTNVAYNEKADNRSWKAMQDFFAEIFPGK